MNFATSKTSPLIDGAEIFGSRIFKIVQILNSDKTYQHYLEQPRLVEKDLMVGYMSYIFFSEILLGAVYRTLWRESNWWIVYHVNNIIVATITSISGIQPTRYLILECPFYEMYFRLTEWESDNLLKKNHKL